MRTVLQKGAWTLMLLLGAVIPAAGSAAWTFKTGGAVYATPLVHGGRVYLGSLDSTFYAIDAASGTEVWRFKTAYPVYSSAAWDENTICFECGNELIGLDENGALRWSVPLSPGPVLDRHDAWDDYHSSPVIADGVAYVGSEQGRVFGVRTATGEVVYRVRTPFGNSTIETPPAVADGLIYFGDWNGVLYAYSLAAGVEVWEYDTRNDNTYSWTNAIMNQPLLWNGALYFAGRSCNLYSLDPKTGARNWMVHDGGSMWLLGGPVVADSALYLGSSNQHAVYAFDPFTGGFKWTRVVDYRVYGRPLPDGDFLFVGTGNETNEPLGSFYALDRVTGHIVARMPCGGQVHSPPVAADGTLFFGCADGTVYALDRQEFVNREASLTRFTSRTKLPLGNIKTTESAFRADVVLANAGGEADSVAMGFTFPAALAQKNAVHVEPERFCIPAHDSAVVTLVIDATPLPAASYSFVLNFSSKYNLADRIGTRSVSFTVVPASGVKADPDGVPGVFGLGPNYPNPFNPSTAVAVELPSASLVRLEVLDVLGRPVKTLIDGRLEAGRRTAVWDGKDGRGSPAGAGAYVCRMTVRTGGGIRTFSRKMLLVK
jgi:eukaryotic-like serine/threonine-protein kinase